MKRYTGGCLCGNVRFVAEGEPYRVGLCHCLDCRKHHGALFHASAVFPQDAVSHEGETGEYRGGLSVLGADRPFFRKQVMKPRCIWERWTHPTR